MSQFRAHRDKIADNRLKYRRSGFEGDVRSPLLEVHRQLFDFRR